MSHTFSQLWYHIIWSTKNRQKTISLSIQNRLYSYLGGITKLEGADLIRINGIEDHVHLLLKLNPTHCPCDIIRTLKCNSSSWIHETWPEMKGFSWQNGYSIFTVSHSGIDDVIRYIQNQDEHHRRMSFAEELKKILVKHGVEFLPDHYLD